jgi:hypothetical protein
MISINEPNEQKERLKAVLADRIKNIRAGFEKLKKVKISLEDFTSLQNALIETNNLGNQVKGDDFAFLNDQLDEIGKLKDEIEKDNFNIQEELSEKEKDRDAESRVSVLQKEIGALRDSIRRLALRSYLREELKNIKSQMGTLKIKKDDFNSLDTELVEKTNRVVAFEDEDDTQLFILRREIGLLRENLEALAVKQSWWSRLPVYARVLLFTVPVVLYLLALSLLQYFNKTEIYNYPATQTAVASQTMPASQATLGPEVTPLPTLTPVP